MNTAELWAFLPAGYLATILIETPVFLVGLSPPHSFARRIFAGLWLTAFTYPMVILVLPVLLPGDELRFWYLLAAEIFAPLAECLLFALAFHWRSELNLQSRIRDYAAIILANLASFGLGELYAHFFAG